MGTLKMSYVFTFILVFDFGFIIKCYILSHKFYFSQNVKTDTSIFFSTFVWSRMFNLNQYRGTVGMFNNHNIAILIVAIYGTVNHFETVVLYLFALQECLKSLFSSSLRVKCGIIHTCLNLFLCISILITTIC